MNLESARAEGNDMRVLSGTMFRVAFANERLGSRAYNWKDAQTFYSAYSG